MRYAKDVLLEKVILHVVDVNADEALIASELLPINEDIESFARKHILKSLKSDETYSAKFINKGSAIQKLMSKVTANTDLFYLFSKGLTSRMFKIIKRTDIPSMDMLFVQYVAGEQRCFAILVLSHEEIYTHNVSFSEDEMNINLITEELGLPNGKELKKCVFFTQNIDDEIEMIVIDKKQKIDENNMNYFTESFLEAILVSDDTDRTRKLKPTIEKWNQRNLCDNIEDATVVRDMVNEKLLSSDEINISELLIEMFGEEEETIESLKSSLEDAGYAKYIEKSFKIDKDYIAKTMLTKQLKTDTGFVLKSDYELFKDNSKFQIKDNGDGTCDYIIKNVRNVNQK